MLKGKDNDYLWLESNAISLAEFVPRFPQILVGKFMAVTSHECGPLRLSLEARLAGWTRDGEIAYSSQLKSVADLPHEEFDEWYVFPERPELRDVEIFVNYACFTLRDPEDRVREAHSTWSAAAIRDLSDSVLEVQKRFWNQMARLAPESYLAEGDSFLFATRNRKLYAVIEASL